MGHKLAVAVPFDGWHALVGAEHPFRRLAPARMRNFWVDVRPEPVLAALDGFPEGHRPLFGERKVDDRLDRFETVFPRQYQPQRRTVLLWNGLAVHAGHQKCELVSRLGDRDALDIGPRVPDFLLPRRGLRVEKCF